MAEPSRVRLVRCPQCENLLPELENYSVYQCGGCGAVLRATNQNLESDAPSHKSDEERKTILSEDTGTACASDAADAEVKSGDSLSTSDGSIPKKNDTICCENGTGKLEGSLKKQDTDGMHVSNAEENHTIGENGDLNSPIRSLNGLNTSQPVFDHPALETRAKTARFVDDHLRDSIRNSRLSTSQFPHERPSCSKPKSYSYSQEMPSQKPSVVDQDMRVQCLEDDRAELLRKLDEIKDHLSRSCDVAAKPRENAPSVRRTFSSDAYETPDSWVPNGCSSSIRASTHCLGHEAHISPHSSQYQELFPCKPNPFPAYRGSSSSQILGTAAGKCHLLHYHPYDRRAHLCADSESFEPFPQREMLHQPACLCFSCCRKHQETIPPIPSASFFKNQFHDATRNHFLHHHENTKSFGSHYHKMGSTIPVRTLSSHEPERQIRGLNSGMGGSFTHFPRRGMAFASGAHRRRPMAGGSPIIACCNCFELLQLPDKVLRVPKIQQKIKCGACSTVISYKIVDKKLVLPFHEEAQTAVEPEGFVKSFSRTNRCTANFSSDDFDNCGYEFLAMDRVPDKPSADNNSSLNNSQETESFPSSSPSITNDENNPMDANSLQGQFRPAHSPRRLGSPFQEHLDYSNNHAGNRFGKGNISSRSDHEKALLSKTTMRQNSLNEASLVTEMEVSYNDYSNTGGSQDSGDGSKEDDQTRTNKGSAESFLASFIKKSFKDFGRSNQAAGQGKTTVSINGHPVPARVIKKAEKYAGSIHPGNYWYDSRAGFWGVMGGPCLGIIPPSIEEFNYPILQKCAGGNTGVFVNGRELHKQDMDLLATRGLPTDRNRSYIVEISGRVWDEDTGKELDCLGKLAPTVEKVKHGFGMKDAKAAAQ